ncbi:YfbM family protein [Metabacillus fastidiosus]|uniref:YfbM family protein n=1 Tax=Metabacillus fastidiosus TaxID=1458 RepID=UPI003D2B8E65
MGMTASYFRISTELLEHIKLHPEQIEEIIFESEKLQEIECDIDKAWHGIYFLLTGEKNSEDFLNTSLGEVVLGGTAIGNDLGYGPLRYLEADEAAEIFHALKHITVDDFSERFNAEQLNEQDIYPMYDEWTEDDKDYLLENYEELFQYFKEAVNNKEAILLLIH